MHIGRNPRVKISFSEILEISCFFFFSFAILLKLSIWKNYTHFAVSTFLFRFNRNYSSIQISLRYKINRCRSFILKITHEIIFRQARSNGILNISSWNSSTLVAARPLHFAYKPISFITPKLISATIVCRKLSSILEYFKTALSAIFYSSLTYF